MSGLNNLFKMIVLISALTACAASADDRQDQPVSTGLAVPEIIIVAERLPDSQSDQPESLEREVDTMIEDEVMLDLTARLAAAAPRT